MLEPQRGPLPLILLFFLAGRASAELFDAGSWAARIDGRLAEAWGRAGVRPAPPVDDAAFLRRVSLDLIGRVPTAAEGHAFQNDRQPDKRPRVVGRLPSTGGHARHHATLSHSVWLPQADAPRFARLAEAFDQSVAGRLSDGTSYNRFVRELLTATTVVEEGALDRRKLPRQLAATVSHGPPVFDLGRTPRSMPAWFRAMARNADGDLSEGKFVGAEREYRRLDRDGDGLISVAEADRPLPSQ